MLSRAVCVPDRGLRALIERVDGEALESRSVRTPSVEVQPAPARHIGCYLITREDNHVVTSFHVSIVWGIAIAVVLAIGILVPFLFREIGKGKRQITPGTPIGAGDARPGTRTDPAPHMRDAQADPYSPRAHRDHPSPTGERLRGNIF